MAFTVKQLVQRVFPTLEHKCQIRKRSLIVNGISDALATLNGTNCVTVTDTKCETLFAGFFGSFFVTFSPLIWLTFTMTCPFIVLIRGDFPKSNYIERPANFKNQFIMRVSNCVLEGKESTWRFLDVHENLMNAPYTEKCS